MALQVRCRDSDLRRRILDTVDTECTAEGEVVVTDDHRLVSDTAAVVVVSEPADVYPAWTSGAVVVTASAVPDVAAAVAFAAAGGRGVLGIDREWLGLSDVEAALLEAWVQTGTGPAAGATVGYSGRHALRILDGLADRFGVPTRRGLTALALWMGVTR